MRPFLDFGTSAAVLVAAIGLAVPAAAITTIDSSAYGLSVSLRVTPLIAVGIAPVAAVGGVAAPAYAASGTLAALDETLGLGTVATTNPLVKLSFAQGVGTGLITTHATSAYPATATGSADATVDDLALGLTSKLGLLPSVTLLGIGAQVIRSTAAVDGTGAPSATGFTSIAGLTLSGTALGGLTIDGSLFVAPAPNTVLVDLLGLEIILNEQLPSGNGVDSAAITVNSIHARFTNFLLGTGLLNGDIIVSDSQAHIGGAGVATVPEPAIWLQLIAGFGAVGVAVRRRTALA